MTLVLWFYSIRLQWSSGRFLLGTYLPPTPPPPHPPMIYHWMILPAREKPLMYMVGTQSPTESRCLTESGIIYSGTNHLTCHRRMSVLATTWLLYPQTKTKIYKPRYRLSTLNIFCHTPLRAMHRRRCDLRRRGTILGHQIIGRPPKASPSRKYFTSNNPWLKTRFSLMPISQLGWPQSCQHHVSSWCLLNTAPETENVTLLSGILYRWKLIFVNTVYCVGNKPASSWILTFYSGS